MCGSKRPWCQQSGSCLVCARLLWHWRTACAGLQGCCHTPSKNALRGSKLTMDRRSTRMAQSPLTGAPVQQGCGTASACCPPRTASPRSGLPGRPPTGCQRRRTAGPPSQRPRTRLPCAPCTRQAPHSLALQADRTRKAATVQPRGPACNDLRCACTLCCAASASSKASAIVSWGTWPTLARCPGGTACADWEG